MLLEYVRYAVGKCHTNVQTHEGGNVTPHMRFPAARGQQPELLCPLYTETHRRQATEGRQTDKQTAGNIHCILLKSLSMELSSRRGNARRIQISLSVGYLPKIHVEVRVDSSPNF